MFSPFGVVVVVVVDLLIAAEGTKHGGRVERRLVMLAVK